jgi:hypothetical protein
MGLPMIWGVYACGASEASSADGGTLEPDASESSSDATIDVSTQSDATVATDGPSNPVEASTQDARVGFKDAGIEVKVWVSGFDGGAVPGVPVYFALADAGTFTVATGADGVAANAMPWGGSITVRVATATGAEITTVIGVKNGDNIYITPLGPPLPSPELGHIVGNVAPYPEGGIVSYGVDLGGAQTENSPPPAYDETVVGDSVEPDGMIGAVFAARDQYGVAIGVATKKVVPPADGGVVTVDVADVDWRRCQQGSWSFNSNTSHPEAWAQLFDRRISFPVGRERYGVVERTTTNDLTATTGGIDYCNVPFPFASTTLIQNIISATSATEQTESAHVLRLPSGLTGSDDYSVFMPQIHDVTVTGAPDATALTWQSLLEGVSGERTASATFYATAADGGVPNGVMWRLVFPVKQSETSASVPAPPVEVEQDLQSPQLSSLALFVFTGAGITAPYIYPDALRTGTSFDPSPWPIGNGNFWWAAATKLP